MAENRTQGAIALLAILAVILAAVAVGPLFTAEQGGDRVGLEQPPLDGGDTQPEAVETLLRPILTAMVLIGLLATLVQFASEPWESFKLLVGIAAGTAAFAAGFWLLVMLLNNLSTGGPPTPDRSLTPQTPSTPQGTTGFGEGSGTPLALPAGGATTIIIVGGVVAVLAFLAWRSDALRSVLSAEAGSETGAVDAELSSLATVAGDTADRIEAAETPRAADNAIYRAWGTMVTLLGVGDPQESTPRQFETAAIEAGMDPDDVGVLTETFEEVRYGDAPLTDERRERAVAALERIEATHGPEQAAAEGGEGS
ncbi:DUF4129 domain-containing protein [Halorhabdus sp. BNX81]|uniref:DUF4129 domain-containing protein n=1 Tax=Halorhabdus sp. BNX81 TaxID=2980181 RepID=UPI0023DCEF00|nr:DUF4129 domain-containing protein [Halorhabdus sp. BNX81]WEL22639.1 Uncharacterized protein HBNXHr_2599 [Halorhabdus sp. BNX81]